MNPDAISLSRGDILSIPDRAYGARDGELVRAVKHERTHRKCLQCEQQLPMIRAFFNAPFCTAAHEHEYREVMEVLMTERLREASVRLRDAMAAQAAI
jgi:hypothetical protein